MGGVISYRQRTQLHFIDGNLNAQKYGDEAARVAQWSKALHRSASCATRDPGSSPGSAATGRPTIAQAMLSIPNE